MHTNQLLLLLFVSSLIHCSLQLDHIDSAKSPSDSDVESDLTFTMQDVLQLFSAQNSMIPQEGSTSIHKGSQPSLLGAHLKKFEALMDISLFTYLSNQIEGCPEEVFFNHNLEPAIPNTPFNQDSAFEIAESMLQENEETFLLKNYGTDEIFNLNEENPLGQPSGIPPVESAKIHENPLDVVIIDERVDRFLVPLILEAVNQLEADSSLSTESSDIESNNAVQGIALAALKGIYGKEDGSDATYSFAAVREDQGGVKSSYVLCFVVLIMLLSSAAILLKKTRAKRDLVDTSRSGQEERNWYVEARDV